MRSVQTCAFSDAWVSIWTYATVYKLFECACDPMHMTCLCVLYYKAKPIGLINASSRLLRSPWSSYDCRSVWKTPPCLLILIYGWTAGRQLLEKQTLQASNATYWSGPSFGGMGCVCVGVGGWNVHLSLRTLLESITYGKTAQAHDWRKIFLRMTVKCIGQTYPDKLTHYHPNSFLSEFTPTLVERTAIQTALRIGERAI